MGTPKSKKDKYDISYEVVKHYGYLNDDKTLAYLNVQWSGGEPRDEIRKIWRNKEGEEYLGKGVPMEPAEIEKLYDIHQRREKRRKEDEDKAKGVDFNSIFSTASDITAAREKGNTTTDGGFIALIRR